MAKSTVVAPVKSGVVLAMVTLEDAVAEMMAQPTSAEDIAQQVLQFDNIDDILGGDNLVIKLDDIIGENFTIVSVELHKSDYEGGLAAYAVIHGRMNDNPVIITSGATQVIAQCIAMHRQGFLPYTVSSEKATKPTAKGYYPIRLCKATESF
jgi:hypothetical protein